MSKEDQIVSLEPTAAVLDPKSGNLFEAVLAADAKVVIGDENSSQFLPCARFDRWDGEASFTMRTPTSKSIAPIFDGKTIGWDDFANNIGARFYTLPTSKGFELGAVEYEVILYDTPRSGEIPFVIETQGLSLFYQPETLTKHELQFGATLPGDVRTEAMQGSIAFYHASKRHNQYKTGKAFHLPRPTATDAKGNWIWGKWQFDAALGLITAAVFDLDWLANAVKPVIVGPTLGFTSVGGSTFGFTGYIVGTHWQMPAAGTATFFNVYTDSGSANFTNAIYNSNGTTPTSRVSQTLGGAFGGGAGATWRNKAITGSLSNGSWYCLTNTNDVGANCNYDLTTSPRSYNLIGSYADGNSPDPFPSPSDDSAAVYSWYIDYSAGGAAARLSRLSLLGAG